MCACKTYQSDTELIKFCLFTPARHNLVSLSVSRALTVCWCVAVLKLSSFFCQLKLKSAALSLLSFLGSPLQVVMLKMWVSKWNAPSHPLMRRSGWLTLRTSHSSKSLRKAAARLTQRWPRIFFYQFIYFFIYWLLFLSTQIESTTRPQAPLRLFSKAARALVTFTCSLAGMSHVTAPCAATFLLVERSSKSILQEKLPYGLISQHESDSCVARQRLDTQGPHAYIYIYLFTYL